MEEERYSGAFVLPPQPKLIFKPATSPIAPITGEILSEGISDDTTLEHLREKMECVKKEYSIWLKKLGIYDGYRPKNKFDEVIDLINDKIVKICEPKYNKILLTINEDEEVNGYKLYEVADNVMIYDIYKELVEAYEAKKEYEFSDFFNEMKNSCCTDWNKMDRYGEPYGGYWRYPEDSMEYKNAYDLSFEDNCKAMWELPFPKEMLLKTIELGCANRMESVRYSNFLCVWVVRKYQLLKESIFVE